MLAALNLDHLYGALVALALGLLVGIERGWSLRHQRDGSRFSGIRTFGLIALAGGISGTLYHHASGPATALMAASAALVVAGYLRTSKVDGAASGTSGMVALLTLACGFLAGSGERMLASVIVVVMVAVLSMRAQLHRWVGRLNQTEIHAIARLALITIVILPLLPDRGFGPYDAWNPRQLWLLVVLVSAFSFVGYFASRLLGPGKGVLATAAAGSMVSSTAVTAALAARLERGDSSVAIAATGIAMGSTVMMLRVLVLTALLAPFALAPLALILAPGIGLSLLATAWFWRTSPADAGARTEEVELRNPLEWRPALILTVLVMAMAVIARWVLAEYGDRGVALVLAISGSVDVDSAIITMGNLPQGTMGPVTGALVLSVPVVLNSLFKAGIAVSLSGWRHARQTALPMVLAALAVVLAALASAF